jgi:DNA repair ATPase RecN
MCKRIVLLLLVLWLCIAWDALHSQEQNQWYLISETELQSIEKYKNSKEAERQNLLLLASDLKTQSATLNKQLSEQRETNRKLTKSFSEYEAAQLTLVSSQHGEITKLKQEMETYKRKAAMRLVIIIALVAVMVFSGVLIIRGKL